MRLPSVPRATTLGFAAGLAALLLWIGYANAPSSFVLPYVAALGLTAACGAYILLATWYDSYRNPRRGSRIRPIRGFDIAAGILLLVPAVLGLRPFLRAF